MSVILVENLKEEALTLLRAKAATHAHRGHVGAPVPNQTNLKLRSL